MTDEQRYGVIDETEFSLMHPRPCDEDFSSEHRALACASEMILDGAEKVSVVKARWDKRDEMYVEDGLLVTIDSHVSHNQEDEDE